MSSGYSATPHSGLSRKTAVAGIFSSKPLGYIQCALVAIIARVLNKNSVSWQTRNNRKLPKHKLSQNAKNLQRLLKFGVIKDNVTVFQRP